jgi:hypothetical protein
MAKRFLLLAIAFWLFVLSAGVQVHNFAAHSTPACQSAQDCADSPRDCKEPVKYLGETNRCACFSCEYGRPNQRILCTTNEADKRTFMLMQSKGRKP